MIFKEPWLYITFKTETECRINVSFKSKEDPRKKKMGIKLQNSTTLNDQFQSDLVDNYEENGTKKKRKPPIDIEDFNLGAGRNKDKIARLHGLIICLIEDVDLLKKFNKQRQVSKNKIIKYHTHVKSCSGNHMNP